MKTALTRVQRAKIVTEISLTYLGGGNRMDVAGRMPRWLDKHAPGCRYPSETEMDVLVKAGKAKYRKTLEGFRQGAAEFAMAVCGKVLK